MLFQSAPSATTETDVYTCPASKTATFSTILICNRSTTTQATFRLSASAGGGATANKDYLYYDEIVPPSSTFAATIGVHLAAGDVVRVYASTANLSFNGFGVES